MQKLLQDIAFYTSGSFLVYKLQFRGLQPFRVKRDDHGLLIFVVVNAARQKTSVRMYRGGKDGAS